MKRNNKNRYLYIVAIFIAAMLPYTACPQSTPILLPPGTVEGRLPNGLHYLILHNASPASRVEFRLIMRVGFVFGKIGGNCEHIDCTVETGESVDILSVLHS